MSEREFKIGFWLTIALYLLVAVYLAGGFK